jgi:hypothetical protein
VTINLRKFEAVVIARKALAEFPSLLALGDTAQAAPAGTIRKSKEKESENIPQRFLRSRQQATPSEAAR